VSETDDSSITMSSKALFVKGISGEEMDKLFL